MTTNATENSRLCPLNSFLKRTRGILFSLLLFPTAVIQSLCADHSPSETTIDQRSALTIGNYSISHYIIEKYYRRYADSVLQEKHRPPTVEENTLWFEDFRAKQTVIAHAESLGYLEREDIRKIVDRMERHMLSRPNGMFYKWHSGTKPTSDADFARITALLPILVDSTIARFNSDSSVEACLGPSFSSLSTEDQTRMILGCQSQGIELTAEPKHWPFLPFAELSEVLVKTDPGSWVRHVDPALGVYFIFIRSVKTIPAPNFPNSFLRQMNEQILARHRRVSLLVSSGFSINESIAAQMLDSIKMNSAGAGQLTDALFQAIGSEVLFRYRIGDENIAVTVEAYRRQFNDQFVRRTPQSLADFCRGVEDMVVKDFDVRAAREQGLHKTAQFVEDRRGFAGFQALALYEEEILTPRINIGSPEVERYYANHADKFRQVLKVHGRILRFDSFENALMWMKQRDEKNASLTITPMPSSEEIDLPSDQPIPGLEGVDRMVIRASNGTRHGPFVCGVSYVVFEKERDLEAEQIPLAAVTDTIRGAILRQLLDERIRQLSRELAAQTKIDDRIDYSRYGIPVPLRP